MDDISEWTSLADDGWVMPSDRSLVDIVAQLGQLLSSPDPSLRDDIGFTALGRWAREGLLDDVLVRLGDDAAQRLMHPQVQARSFAALALAVVLRRREVVQDAVPAAEVERWCDAFLRWYPAETDTRGWDDELGWLHAVAHGADTTAAFAHHLPHRRDELLDACARRITNPATTARYVQLEDARLARALVEVLSDLEVTERQGRGRSRSGRSTRSRRCSRCTCTWREASSSRLPTRGGTPRPWPTAWSRSCAARTPGWPDGPVRRHRRDRSRGASADAQRRSLRSVGA